MNGFVWAVGVAMVLLAGVMSYAVTRRYGWGTAVMLPVVAIAAVIGMTWQEQDLGFTEGMALAVDTLVFAAPILGGALAGIAIGWRRRG